jgi:hypothetical protein
MTGYAPRSASLSFVVIARRLFGVGEYFLLVATVSGDSAIFEARPNDASNRKCYLPQPIEVAVAKVERLIAPGYHWKLDELLNLGFNKLSNPPIMNNNSLLRRKLPSIPRRKGSRSGVRHVYASVASTG